MPIEILMPALSPTMKEGNLATWLKKEGDKIKAGEVIAEIETDKATMEVEAVDAGILAKIIVPAGTENVAVNSLIALIIEEGETLESIKNYQVKQPENNKSNNNQEANKASGKSHNQANSNQENKPFIAENSSINSAIDNSSKIKASPLAKRIAEQNNFSLANIANTGSGPSGRIVKDDVLNAIKSGNKNFGVRRNPQEFTAVKNSNIRKVIARRLLESKQNVPHFYLSCELNIDKMLEVRASMNSVADIDKNEKPAYKISVNDLIIKACAMALNKVPNANSSWSDESLLLFNNVDISVAVAIEGGLITPIIKNADQKSIIEISSEMKLLAKKAREGKLQPEEFQGGSFSISNLGMYGIDNFSAIVNPPQSCILAISRAIEKPIAVNGLIKVANMMNITLSADHRCVDGAVAAEFLKALRDFIENPILMLL